ncbi:MAG: alpha/beta hydrolase [Rhizobiales bacterium]|nr:alpha/beta hydrolase [Hyphomicrobiales bacterium]
MSVEIFLVEIEGNKIPQNAKVDRFETFDGIHLRYAVFKTELAKTKGTICVFTGRSEPIEKYFETIKNLQIRGYDVAIMDWRGQGLSDRLTSNRRKGHVTTFENYAKDVDVFMGKIVKQQCKKPYIALSHSTGACVLTQVLAEPKTADLFEKVILISPFYKFEISTLKNIVVRFISAFLVTFGMGKLKATFLEGMPKELKPFDSNNLISSDKFRMEREQKIIKANLNLAIGAPTFGWLHAAFLSIKKINNPKFVRNIRTPVLILMGLGDYLVSQKSIRKVASNVKNCKLIEIDDGRHELLMERDELQKPVWAAIDAFI